MNHEHTSKLHRLRTLHLFAGAGGGILSDLLLGHQPICAVEIEPYCQQVLHARQKDGILPWFPIFADVKEFDGKPWRGIADVVCGGFPCQDISAAGKGAGINGERSGLWGEMARIICEVRPRFAFLENSPMLTSRGLGRVLGDLAAMGYDAKWCVLGADDVGAPHRRKRIWILAHSNDFTRRTEHECKQEMRAEQPFRSSKTWAANVAHTEGGKSGQPPEWEGRESACGGSEEIHVADTNLRRCEQCKPQGESFSGFGGISERDDQNADVPDSDSLRSSVRIPEQDERKEGNAEITNDNRAGWPSSGGWWGAEPNVGRVAHGVAFILDNP